MWLFIFLVTAGLCVNIVTGLKYYVHMDSQLINTEERVKSVMFFPNLIFTTEQTFLSFANV